MDKKQAIRFFLALFVGLIFISSYYTFRNLNGGAQSQKTKQASAPQTVPGFGTANAGIVGYNNTMYIYTACNTANETGAEAGVSAIVSELEKNGTVYDSYSIQNETVVQSGSANASYIYSVFMKRLNATSRSCLRFSSYAEAELPNQVQLFIYTINKTYPVNVPQNLSVVQVPVTLSANMSKVVKVRIAALIELNGTVYSLNVTKLE